MVTASLVKYDKENTLVNEKWLIITIDYRAGYCWKKVVFVVSLQER
jgi:hypothetical protein